MTRDDCIRAAGEAFARACSRQAAMSPAEAARAAYQHGGPSVTELERRIRARRTGHPVAA